MQTFSEPCQYPSIFVIENNITHFICRHVSEFRKIVSIFFIGSILKIWFLWQYNIKCASSSITPYDLQSRPWIGVFDLVWRPSSMAKVCKLVRICAIALRNGRLLLSRYMAPVCIIYSSFLFQLHYWSCVGEQLTTYKSSNVNVYSFFNIVISELNVFHHNMECIIIIELVAFYQIIHEVFILVAHSTISPYRLK